ncbi:hypothetical protein B0T25DRAFT_576806 [Lasiosphaeria hispida]|uniref:F-box domain-containing protein n=1 Tax=Lasiosphaeria hispida TaxID=260671 RepID=A0AAJ0HX80_9PEZI|nr:hypothetical protein B0T25DRAFT_576806 [Lasiosphaeria hispida]
MSAIPISMMDPSAPPSPRRLLLCDLPDDVLLAVMSQADHVSLFCLKRVSRIFLRLFKDRRFRHVHIDPFTSRWPFHLSPTWKLEKVAADIKPILRPLLQKDLYCQTCRNTGPEAELRLRTKLLYCSGCRTNHPAGLFSHGQRYGPSDTRICIGREGNIRICDHMVITWADVEEWLASGRLTSTHIKMRKPALSLTLATLIAHTTAATTQAPIWPTLLPTVFPSTPTGTLKDALLSYGEKLVSESCTLTGIDVLDCPYPDKPRWCAFATAAPTPVVSEFKAHGSVASSWWAAHSSKTVSLAQDCPVG